MKNITYKQTNWEEKLNNSKHYGCINWKVYACHKRKNGKLTPTGTFKVIAEPIRYNVGIPLEKRTPIIRYGKSLTEKQIQNTIKRFQPISKTAEIIAWYRKTNIIPKHIAKTHNAKLLQMGLQYYTEAFNKVASAQLWTYMIRFGKCPDCKKRGFDETIFGIKCKHCDFSIHDYNNELKIVTAKTAIEKYTL